MACITWYLFPLIKLIASLIIVIAIHLVLFSFFAFTFFLFPFFFFFATTRKIRAMMNGKIETLMQFDQSDHLICAFL